MGSKASMNIILLIVYCASALNVSAGFQNYDPISYADSKQKVISSAISAAVNAKGGLLSSAISAKGNLISSAVRAKGKLLSSVVRGKSHLISSAVGAKSNLISSIANSKSNFIKQNFAQPQQQSIWKIHKYSGIELKPVSAIEAQSIIKSNHGNTYDSPPAAIKLHAPHPTKINLPTSPINSYGPPEKSVEENVDANSALNALSNLGAALPEDGLSVFPTETFVRLYNHISALKRGGKNSLDYEAIAAQKKQSTDSIHTAEYPLTKIHSIKAAKAHVLNSGIAAVSNLVSRKHPELITDSVTYKDIPIQHSKRHILNYIPFFGQKLSQPYISGFGKVPEGPRLPLINLSGNFKLLSSKNGGYVSIKAPHDQVAVPAPPTPVDSYGPPPAPVDSYGPPPAPVSSYGPPTAPVNTYGPPPAPINSYGPPPAPVSSYGPPPAPVNTYGPPPAPINSYVLPPAPVNSYGPPPAPANSYGSPTAPVNYYEVPTKEIESLPQVSFSSYAASPATSNYASYNPYQSDNSPPSSSYASGNIINVPESPNSGSQYYSFPSHSDYVIHDSQYNNFGSAEPSFAASEQNEEWQPSESTDYSSHNNSPAEKQEQANADNDDASGAASNVEYSVEDVDNKNQASSAVEFGRKLNARNEIKEQTSRKSSNSVETTTAVIDVEHATTTSSLQEFTSRKPHSALENLKSHSRPRPIFLRTKESTTEHHDIIDAIPAQVRNEETTEDVNLETSSVAVHSNESHEKDVQKS